VQSGRHYLARRGACTGVPVENVIRCAVQSLGLDEVAPFDPKERILELRLARKHLVAMDLEAFSAELSTDSPAPGGGSVAALAGALGASLVSMVANLTFGKKNPAELRSQMQEVALDAQSLRTRLLEAVDRDTEAFNDVMAAFRLPRQTPEQRKARRDAIGLATIGAARVPLEVMQMSVEVLELSLLAVEKGSAGSITDAGVSGLMGRACCAGARMNVLINLKGLKDERFAAEARSRCAELMARADELASLIETKIEQSLA
jgi:glutamate formiminotransferase/formiminotetrahydrofolate cyclodeaminase